MALVDRGEGRGGEMMKAMEIIYFDYVNIVMIAPYNDLKLLS